MMRNLKLWPLAFCLLLLGAQTQAAPVNVSYSISGSAGHWTLNFTVANNLALPSDQAVYLFGLKLSTTAVTKSPASYDSTIYTTWSNAGLGSGSNTLYNNVWEDATASNLLPGTSLSGFSVLDTDTVAPTSVQWFTLLTGSVPFNGSGSFTGDPYNPGFEGVATPEPGTAILGALLICWLVARRFCSSKAAV